ncbi:hypothetical protein DWW69_01925 [Bacteroides sp. AF16-49]|uniref:leucine-rich repeat protein n=1 Tax=Bacteroides sp. AF16-49 TaxID=2292192 RepID=UPI000F00B8AD|nr:leucine-rich repeat protein [Bacteroides sp. AF16-49]RHR82162.1 hypothetical protein DWW69_01925 [Bacteroides sp. AF16-49]
MKKTITLISTMFACITMQARMDLTIETTPGELKNVMTQEQIQNVEDLTLTGGMNKEDFYFIRDQLVKLKSINMKQIEVDTIPVNALFGKELETIVLPIHIKYIDENALNTNARIYLTGPYPKRAAYIGGISFILSNDNIYCKKTENGIFSSDGKILYEAFENYKLYFEEGLEIIETYAFVNVGVRDYRFPKTLKVIKEKAFYNLDWLIPVSFMDYSDPTIIMKAKEPPVLGENAFVMSDEQYCEYPLSVPEGCIEIYRNADPQWKIFRIREGDQPQGIESVSTPNLSITRSGNSWILNGEKNISKIEIFSTIGALIFSSKCNDTQVEIPMGKTSEVVYARVLYADNTTEVIKLIK